MIPQVLIFVAVVLALATSIWRDVRLGFLNIATVWLTVNCIALIAFLWIGVQESIRAGRSVAPAAAGARVDQPAPRRGVTLVPVLDRSQIEDARDSIGTVASTGDPSSIEWPDTPAVAQPMARGKRAPRSSRLPRRGETP